MKMHVTEFTCQKVVAFTNLLLVFFSQILLCQSNNDYISKTSEHYESVESPTSFNNGTEVTETGESTSIDASEYINHIVKFSSTCNSENECMITVIEPNKDDIWCMNENMRISWTSSGTSGSVSIFIYASIIVSSHRDTVVFNTPDDGSYDWSIPSFTLSFPRPFSKLRWMISISDVEDNFCYGRSEYFKICNCKSIEIFPLDYSERSCGLVHIQLGLDGSKWGCGPYTWMLISGQLPTGLDFNSSGEIHGETSFLGSFECTVKVVDDIGHIDQENVSIDILKGPVEKGDLNGDCKINVLDVIRFLACWEGFSICTDVMRERADCNGPAGNCSGDGILDALDFWKIVDIILGWDECHNIHIIEDLEIDSLQVVQAAAPSKEYLVADKRTLVRIWLNTGVDFAIPGIDVGLQINGPGFSNQTFIINDFEVKTEFTCDDSFYALETVDFYFPNEQKGWPYFHEGLYDIYVEVDPYNEIPEIDENNKVCYSDYSFKKTRNIKILYCRVKTPNQGIPTNSDCQNAHLFMNKTYPVASNGGVSLVEANTIDADCTPPPYFEDILHICINGILGELEKRYWLNYDPKSSENADWIVGFVPIGFLNGPPGVSKPWGKSCLVEAGQGWEEETTQMILAHEIGHMYGLGDEYWICNGIIRIGSPNYFVNPPPFRYPSPPCYDFEDLVWCVEPYCFDFNQGSEGGNYVEQGAFDIEKRILGGRCVVPTEPCSIKKGNSFMGNALVTSWESGYSYTAWITSPVYGHLYGQLSVIPKTNTHILAQTKVGQIDESIMLSGLISKDGICTMDFGYKLKGSDYPDFFSGGPYSIELRDKLGNVLGQHYFDLSFLLLSDPPESTDVAPFCLVVPYPTETSVIYAKLNDNILKTLNVSNHAPTIQVISPNGGEYWKSMEMVNWTSTDGDDDVLKYAVLYSNDGNKWITLAVDLVDTFFLANTLDIEGGNHCLIKVLATDGVNTSEDVSDDPFEVTKKPPSLDISSPNDGAEYLLHQTIVFQGVGSDKEDGILSGASLEWSSDIDGIFGTGELVYADDLSPGVHIVTLTGTDSDGMKNSDSIVVSVVLCIRGDVNCKEHITPGDALCAFWRSILGQWKEECECPCSDHETDINCDGEMTPGDALCIFWRSILGSWTEDCRCGGPIAKVPKTPLASQMLLGTAKLTPVEILVVPLHVEDPKGIDAFSLQFTYPTEILKFDKITTSIDTKDWIAFGGVEITKGTLTIGGFSQDALTSEGTVCLGNIHFQVKRSIENDILINLVGATDDLEGVPFILPGIKVAEMPREYALRQNYPNPFNPQTTIEYSLPEASVVKIEVYNILGQQVKTLIEEYREAGYYKAIWDGRDHDASEVSSGVYFYRLHAGNFVEAKKMILLK